MLQIQEHYLAKIYATLGKPVPFEVIRRVERIRSFVQICKPEGDLMSSQIISLVVEQYERENESG